MISAAYSFNLIRDLANLFSVTTTNFDSFVLEYMILIIVFLLAVILCLFIIIYTTKKFILYQIITTYAVFKFHQIVCPYFCFNLFISFKINLN